MRVTNGGSNASVFARAGAKAAQIRTDSPVAAALKRSHTVWIAVALVVFALAIHHGWLTWQPLAAGDSPWVSSGRLQAYGPWPTIWDPTSGFGTAALDQSNQAPFEALWALLARLGVGFSVVEKVFYFWPFAILSVIAPWLLARELLGSARWAALSAVIFATNTHILLRGAVHLGIATAMCLGVLAFWAAIRAQRRHDVHWAGAAGLLLALETVYDLRIAVLTVFCLLIKVVIELIAASTTRARRSVLEVSGVSFVMLAVTQLTWLVPLAAYRGQPSLPIPSAPSQGFATLAHAFTAVDPSWTGGTPVFFRSAMIPWEAYFTPLIAFAALLLRRIRLEIAWLLLLGLGAAFLIKQDLPPFAGVYTWLFQHLPGWDLFRDGTKLSWIVAVAYAVVIPLVAQAAWKRLSGRQWIAAGCVALLLAAPAVQVVLASVATARGDLGETTHATPEPSSFRQLEGVLNADPHRSIVAYFGGTVVWDTIIHRFLIASVNHPDLELSGSTHPYDPVAQDNDPLNPFCAATVTPFCYLQPGLFPYLVHEFGIGYIVAPVGTDVGTMPTGVGRPQLVSRLTSLLGERPAIIGEARDAIALWRVQGPAPLVTASTWLASVQGPPQTLTVALPALVALGAPPPIFDDGYRGSTMSQANVIDVVPCVASHYNVSSPGEYSIAIPEGEPVPTQLSAGGQVQTLHTLGEASGITIVGPINLEAGSTAIAGAGCAEPLIAWSNETAQILARAHTETTVPYTSLENETVSISSRTSGWLIFREGFDREWQLTGSDVHVDNAPFNAFHLVSSTTGPLTIGFGTRLWEIVGAIAAGALTFTLLVLLWLRPAQHHERALIALSTNNSAWWISLVGLGCVIVAMIAQALANAGVTSFPAGSFSEALSGGAEADVYGAPVFYVALAMTAFLIAIVIALASGRPGMPVTEQRAESARGAATVAEQAQPQRPPPRRL